MTAVLATRLHRSGAVLALVSLVGLLIGVPSASGQQAAFQITGSELQEDGATTITVSLAEELEEPLTAADVQVEEDGAAVEGLTVEPIGGSSTPVSLGVALVIDTSGSAAGAPIEAAKDAAQAFLVGLAETGAQGLLVAFADEARLVAPLTQDIESLGPAIEGLTAEGETALYDAVVLAADELAAVDGQRTMVVFSDGADTVSSTSADQAIQATNAAEATLRSVVLSSPDLDEASLEALASGTGGTTITVDSTEQLGAAFESVATSLTNQYVITYTSDVTDPTELDLAVTVALPSGSATQSFTVLNPRQAAPPVVEPPPVIRSPGVLGTSAPLIVGLLAAFVAVGVFLTLLVLTPRSRAAKFLDRELKGYVEGSGRRADPSAVAEALRRRASLLLDASPSGAQFQSRVQKMLDQAALPLKTVELLAIMIVGALLLGMIGLTLVGWRAVVVFAPVGIVAPWLFVVVKRNKRLSRFLEMLPDTLQLIAGSLAAGYGVLQSIDMVTRESEDPMSTEFNRVLVESRLGMPLEESLEAMAARMDSDDFRWVVLAMNIQREVGGNLASLMQTVAQTLRDREALRRHIKALSAEGKLSAIILVALPIFLAGYLVLVNPEYVGTLVESLVGWVMIVGGLIGMVIGVIWIRNLIQAIEV